jgi:hypothetical protein
MMRLTIRRMAFAAIASLFLFVLPGVGRTAPVRAAGPITYPDLQIQIPPSDFSIGHPTSTSRELRYTHLTWNAGSGPFELRPSYDPATGMAQPAQALYISNGSDGWTFASTVPVLWPMAYDPALAKYRFPLASFELRTVAADGSVGGLVAPSPKAEFCMTEDTYVGGVPNTPSTPNYPPNNCGTPTGTLGLDVGWADKYDETDPGQAIDLTNVPDGTYWLRATVDPERLLAQSSQANDITDTEIAIAGDSVTVLKQVNPDSTPPTVTLTSPSPGASINGTLTLAASVAGPAPIASVQFLLDGQPVGPSLSAAPYAFAWDPAGTPYGSHVLGARVVDARGIVGRAAGVPITLAQTIGSFRIDVSVQQLGSGTATTPVFSTPSPGELLLALVSSDGTPGSTQTATVSGAGLTWTLVARSNDQAGDAEIWKASAAAPLSGATVTSTTAAPGSDELLTVLSVQGTSGVGASVAASATSGAPSVRLTTTAAGSWAVAAGMDWDAAVGRTVAPGQILVSEQIDSAIGDTFWSQATSAAAAATGSSVTLADSAPTNDRWNLAAVEVLAGSSTPPSPSPPPSVSIANPAAGQVVSGTTPVAVNATGSSPVTSVQVLLDGQPLGQPLTKAPYGLSWDTTKVANGSHQIGATATDAAGNVGTAAPVTVTVNNPMPPMVCFNIDVRTSADGHDTVTTPAFHTALAGERLLAFAASDGPSSGRQALTISGAGLTWTLVQRANSRLGTAEIWTATATTVLASATVTSIQSARGFDQSLTVIAMQGTGGIGASAGAGAPSGAPSVTLATKGAGSLVFGVGNDWDSATPRTIGLNQVLLHQWADEGSGDTFWSQNTTAPVGPAGTLATLDDTAPTMDQWNFAAIEVLADSG